MNEQERLFDLLNRFCTKAESVSTEELHELLRILSGKEKHEQFSMWIQQKWDKPDTISDDVDFESIYKKVYKQIKNAEPHKRGVMYYIPRVAAILLLPMLCAITYLMIDRNRSSLPVQGKVAVVNVPAQQEYITPAGVRTKILLSDSTEVWLNASSRLTVGEGFGVNSRNVKLTGEAFFEVSKNKKLPFLVSTHKMEIMVTGTAFNVLDYADGKYSETVLVNGRIELKSKAGSNSHEVLIVKPQQRIMLSDNDIDVQSNVQTDIYTSWMSGKLIFHKTPIEDVAKTLERWYNTKIIIKDSLLKQYMFTGTFENRSLEQILGYIALSSSMSYKIEQDHVVLQSLNQ